MSFDPLSTYVPIVGTLVGIIIAIGSFINRNLTKRNNEQDAAIQRLREDLLEEQRKRIIHETQFNFFWDYWKKEVPKVLMKPHTPEVDEYMAKMSRQHGELSEEDKVQLVNLLQELLDAEYDVYNIDKEKGTYLALLARFRTELKMPEEITKINQKYDEELRSLQQQYEEKKKRRLKFWQ